MARCEYDGFERIEGVLTRLSRDAIREVVMAGADACVEETKKNILQYRHVVTGAMMEGVAAGKYHEDIGSGWVEVYPQGDDSRGISNAQKAFVINYGYGNRRTGKTGDKFITGSNKTMEEVVARAMQAKSDEIIKQLNGG
jgi:hypothetical protein